MYGSKLTLVVCPEENELFLVWGSTGLAFVWVVGMDMVLYACRKLLDSSISIDVDLVFVSAG